MIVYYVCVCLAPAQYNLASIFVVRCVCVRVRVCHYVCVGGREGEFGAALTYINLIAP